MSGAVGSNPAFTRSGMPVFAERSSLRRSSSSGTQSAVPFRRSAICSSMVIVEVYKSCGVRLKRFADGQAFAVANAFVGTEEEKGEPLSRDRVRREPDLASHNWTRPDL